MVILNLTLGILTGIFVAVIAGFMGADWQQILLAYIAGGNAVSLSACLMSAI
ncbi:hypothetical protein ACOI1H_18065 [Loktanella sp. DJP18]|uniref:hypothetical protein n=1 Tax=Loktanella sp. DJP18 TaxID=3409788 RepID=UPI003BB69EFE